MHKVTASAVILTALTGCNQSGVPSAQWSFELPADDFSNSAQFTTDDALGDDSFSATLPSGIQPETQSFLRQPSGDMMGPAFEQPSGVDVLATDLTRGLPGTAGLASSQFSSLVTTATNDDTSAFIQAAARPDPVAAARRYVARDRQPALITSRVPYSYQPYSQSVYLPSSPAASPLSALGVVGVPSPSQSAFVDTQSAGSQGAQGTGLQVLGTPIVPEAQVSPQVSVPVATPPAGSFAQPELVALGALPVSPTTLPVLETAAVDVSPAASSPLPEATASAIAPPRDADVPIGTAILRDLQRNGGVQSSPVQPVLAEMPVEAPERTATTDLTPALDASLEADRALSTSVAPFRPTVQSPPTLERLLSSRPAREASPMVARLQVNGETQIGRLPEAPLESGSLSPQSGLPKLPAAPELTPDILTPDVSAAGASTSGNSPVGTQLQSSAATLDSSARRNYSPLLASLQAQDNAVSTIYVPISEAPSLEVSASLVQSAIAALGNEAWLTASNTTQPMTTAVVPASPLTTVSQGGPSDDVSGRLAQVEPSPVPSLASLFSAEKAVDSGAIDRLTDSYKSSKGDAAALLGIANKQRARYRQRISWR